MHLTVKSCTANCANLSENNVIYAHLFKDSSCPEAGFDKCSPSHSLNVMARILFFMNNRKLSVFIQAGQG